MILLLDAHALIWWFNNPRQLSKEAREALIDRDNAIIVSTVVVWEIAIKRSLGKLNAPNDLNEAISDAGFHVLPVTIEHALATESLPWHHRDPFDRMLIAQAISEGMTLISRDRQIRTYNVPLVIA